jgi:hypothetical protein
LVPKQWHDQPGQSFLPEILAKHAQLELGASRQLAERTDHQIRSTYVKLPNSIEMIRQNDLEIEVRRAFG